MQYNKQTDIKWKNEDMAIEGDKIGRWGCLLTCIANILQDIKGTEYTPKDLNIALKMSGGYAMQPKGQESFLKWSSITKIFNVGIQVSCKILEYDPHTTHYWIARVIHPVTRSGHYVNLIRKTKNHWICYDVEDGKLKYYDNDDITSLNWIRT